MLRETESVRSLNQELTFEYVKKFFKEREIAFEKAQYRTLGIVNEDGYYTNVGLLLSDQCEHSIKYASYNGKTKLEFHDRREFTGSILKQLDEAYAYIDLHNKVHADFHGLNRVEVSSYPAYAIREALINAVVHRDYSFSGSVLVHIFEDRMEIVSVGGLVNGLTVEDILLGVSESRNKNLAACFYRLKLIESYGTGIQRMQESYEVNTVEPQFKVTENAFLVVLPNKLSPTEEKAPKEVILEIIHSEGKVARKRLETELGLSKTRVSQLLSELVEEAKIIQQGNGRNIVYILA